MQQEEKRKLWGIIRPTNLVVGLVIAAVYVALTLLIPSNVKVLKNAMTNARVYPYIVFIAATALAIGYAFAFRGARYTFDLGIWPMVLGSVIYYFGIRSIGFYTATFVIIIYMMRVWKCKRWLVILLTAVLTPAVIYLFFTLGMSIYMPKGILF